MANNFPWDDKNFISEYWLRNYRAVQKIIFDCECVQELKIFFSANQVLYYGHMALVKLKELFVTTDHKKYASDNKLCLEFQTEANFLLFAFLQIVTPYRDIIKKSGCFTKKEINHYFFKNGQADFFQSLRNFQTHCAIPVFPWQVHKNFATGATYLDIHTSEQLVDSIVDYAESDQNKYKSFQSGGLDFLNENKQTPIYILENDFLNSLLSIHKIFYDRLIRACLETSAFIVTRRHVDKKRLCAAAKTREDCQTVPQRSDGQRMGACTSSPAPCFWRRSEAQNRPA